MTLVKSSLIRILNDATTSGHHVSFTLPVNLVTLFPKRLAIDLWSILSPIPRHA